MDVPLPKKSVETNRLKVSSKSLQPKPSRKDMATLFDNLAYAIVGVGLDRRITYYNKAAEQLFGFSPAEIIGRPVLDALSMILPAPADLEPVLQHLRTYGQSCVEYECITKDGLKFIEMKLAYVYDPHAQPIGVISTCSDITSKWATQKALVESQAALQQDLIGTKILQSISVALLNNDLQTLYEKILDAAAQLMHSKQATMQVWCPERGSAGELQLLASRGLSQQAMDFWQWITPTANRTPCAKALLTRQRIIIPDISHCDFMQGSDDYALYLQNGLQSAQSTPLLSRDGQLVGMLSTYWKTPRTPSERELRHLDILARQATELIERKITEDNLHLNEQRQKELARKLRVVDQQKDAFLAMLSHELRNPIAAIRDCIQILDQGSPRPSQEQHLLSIINRQSLQLHQLVGDLLDVSQAIQDRIQLKQASVDLNLILQQIKEDHKLAIDASGLDLVFCLAPCSLPVWGDPVRLTQIFWNLIHNAMKFTPTGGRVTVTSQMAADKKWALIHVRDTGVGISPPSTTLGIRTLCATRSSNLPR